MRNDLSIGADFEQFNIQNSRQIDLNREKKRQTILFRMNGLYANGGARFILNILSKH